MEKYIKICFYCGIEIPKTNTYYYFLDNIYCSVNCRRFAIKNDAEYCLYI